MDTSVPCFVCLKPTKITCAKCKVVSYCSKKCQKLNWKTHREICKNGFVQIGGEDAAVFDKATWDASKFGCCLDCLVSENKAITSGWFCDQCKNAYICDKHDYKYGSCRRCRGLY